MMQERVRCVKQACARQDVNMAARSSCIPLKEGTWLRSRQGDILASAPRERKTSRDEKWGREG